MFHTYPARRLACYARRTVSVLLVVSLIAPSVAFAQPPTREAPREPVPADRAPLRPEPRPDVPLTGTRLLPGADYRLGPGDVLDVQVVGRLEVARHQVVVNQEGAIMVPPLGAIEVGGLALAEAHRKVSERARALFRFVDVALAIVVPRSFEVVVSGEVDRPGAILTGAYRRLHEVIVSVGGVTPRGSVRRVRVARKGVEREVDLLRFELAGDLAQNPFVEEGMRIHVPPRGPSVTVTGAVRRTGEYEVGPRDSLAELLALVGGLHATAAPSDARLTRIGPDGRKQTLIVDLARALTPPADVPLRSGDVLHVPTVAAVQDLVEVRGAFVGTPDSGKTVTAGKPTIVQRFELAQGERVTDILRKAGGPAPFADLGLAVVDRAGTGGPAQRIPIDLRRVLVDKDASHDILVQNGDVLTLPVAEDKVFVVGEIRTPTPGPQDFRPGFTIRDYLAQAGGPAPRAKLDAITVTFRSGKTFLAKDAPPIEPGAVISVPEVSVRWWQDYVTISNVVIGLVSAYTGLYILFGGRVGTVFGSADRNR